MSAARAGDILPIMRASCRTTFLLLTLAIASVPCWAVDTTLTAAGYTGLGVTPTAQIVDWGRLATSYENQLAGNRANLGGHNLVLGFGLLPNLEASGRFAANSLHDNCFAGCGARDLSASAKMGIGLDAAHRWSIALGATDIGGSVTYFRSVYGVLTYDNGPVAASAGLARRREIGIGGSQAPLNGGFGSIAWQPLPLLRGHLEYSDGKSWAGVRVFAPGAWMPNGWSLSAGANARLGQTDLTQRSWWNVALSIPLYSVPAMPVRRDARQAPSPQPQPAVAPRAAVPPPLAPQAPAATATPAPVQSAAATDAQLQALADSLQAKGLEDISIGRMPDRTIAVRANNGSYEWNAVDALGVALGTIARTLGDARSGYRLILTQRQVPLVAVTGQADCLRQWIEQPANTCTAGQLSTPGSGPLEPLHDGAQWVVQNQNPAWQTVRVNLSPVLRTAIGTEVGALDTALGANVRAELPLWAGASVAYGVNVPIANSRNFEPGTAFGNRRIQPGTERLAFTHTTRVPLERWLSPAQGLRAGPGALTAQLTAGRIGTFYDGALAALRWEPGEGRHRVSAQAGVFRNNRYEGGFGPLGSIRRATAVLASYRYSVMATRTDLEATAGQFMNNDRGFQVGMRQWFNDVSVGVYYKRTTTSGDVARQLVGVELALPIGPRRDWQPLPHLQVGGTPRFAHAVETSIHEGGGNPLRLGRGVRPPTPDLDAVFNADRSSLLYFEDNLRRVREAAQH